MQAAKAHGTPLPDEAFGLWVRDELADFLGVPDDGSRVEIVGGEIVVSPGPGVSHNSVVIAIQEAFMAARLLDTAYPWQAVHTTDLAVLDIQDGYIPDLIILRRTDFAASAAAQDAYLTPDLISMVIEVTSHSMPSAIESRAFGTASARSGTFTRVRASLTTCWSTAPRASDAPLCSSTRTRPVRATTRLPPGSSANRSGSRHRSTSRSTPTPGTPGTATDRVRYASRFAASSRKSAVFTFAVPVISISSSRKNSTRRGTL